MRSRTRRETARGQPNSARRGRTALAVPFAALGLLAGCWKSSSGDAQHAAAPLGPRLDAPFTASGRLEICGALAHASEGGIALRLVEQSSGRVILQRTYDLRDPVWDRRPTCASVYWALGPEHAFDAGEPVHAPLVLEAVQLPPSRPAEPHADDPRVAVAVGARTSELDLSLMVGETVAASDQPRVPPSNHPR